MAQLRRDYDQFQERETTVVVVGPENADAFRDFFTEHELPFYGLPDPKHGVLKQFGQEVDIFKLGRMPAQLLIDREGIVRFVNYGKSMRDIPENKELLAEIDRLNEETRAAPHTPILQR